MTATTVERTSLLGDASAVFSLYLNADTPLERW